MVSAGDSFPARCAATIAATVSVTQHSASEGDLTLSWRTMLPAYKSSCNRSKGCAMCTLSGARRNVRIDIYYQIFDRGLRMRSATAVAPRIVNLLNFEAGLPRHFAASLGDQPRRTLVARVNPQPAQRDAEPVAQADQEIDVCDAPDPPRDGAAQLDAAEIDYREPLADLRQAAGMLVMERSGSAAGQARLDGGRDITSLLLGGRRNSRHRLAVPGRNRHGVADCEDVGMAGHGQIRLDLKPSG